MPLSPIAGPRLMAGSWVYAGTPLMNVCLEMVSPVFLTLPPSTLRVAPE